MNATKVELNEMKQQLNQKWKKTRNYVWIIRI